MPEYDVYRYTGTREGFGVILGSVTASDRPEAIVKAKQEYGESIALVERVDTPIEYDPESDEPGEDDEEPE